MSELYLVCEVQQTWATNGRTLILHRHEIENYLLEPRVILGAFLSFRATTAKPWAKALPTTESEVVALLRRAMASRLDAHAAGVLHRALHVACREAGSTAFRCPPAPPDDGKAMGREAWIRAFHEEAVRMKADCHAVAGLAELDPMNIAISISSGPAWMPPTSSKKAITSTSSRAKSY